MRHKRVRAGSNDKLSAGAWNDMVELLNGGGTQIFGQSRLPAILQNSTIVSAVTTNGEIIGPFQPVRIKTPRNLTNYVTGNVFEVEEVTPEDSNYWTYGFTLNEGVSEAGGGRVVVSGVAIVKMTRSDFAGASLAYGDEPWAGQWYNLPDNSICSSGHVMGPVGRYQAISVWDLSVLEDQTSSDTDEVYIAIDLNSAPSQVVVDLQEDVDGMSAGVMSSGSCEVLHGTTNVVDGEFTTDTIDGFEIEVYNPFSGDVSTGQHVARWSAEYNCFLLDGQAQRREVFCVPTADITSGGSGTCKVWSGAPLAETSETITVYLDWAADGVNAYEDSSCRARLESGRWHFIAAECQGDDEVAVKVGSSTGTDKPTPTTTTFAVWHNADGTFILDTSGTPAWVQSAPPA